MPHKLDVMHCSKNFTDNILNIVFYVGKDSKDNKKTRQDLQLLTRRSSLFMASESSNKKPKAAYTINLEQRRAICQWIKELRFPDGHVSNLQSNARMQGDMISGLKTHDSHVFMQ